MPRSTSNRVVVFESVGFLTVMLLIWLNELLDLPHLLLGAPSIGPSLRWEEALLESGAVFLLGVGVVAFSRWTSLRLAYLESFVVLCAWCRRVKLDEEWVGLERFLQAHRARTSHGVCPDCAARLQREGGAAD